MTKNTFWLSLPLCIVIALLAAFLFTTPAFAQDELPPEVVPTEAPVEALPTEAVLVEVVPTEVPAEVLPTEVAPAEELPAEAAPVEEPGLAEALDDAGVIFADSSGEPVSLATRSAGMLVTEGDPYFTVGSITYHFYREGTFDCTGIPYCFTSATPIQAALNYMSDPAHILTPTDRKLYIEADIYNEFVNVNGSLNGVKGLTGIIGLGATPDDVRIHGMIQIHDFANGFSLTNLSVLNDYGDTTNGGAIETWANGGTLKFTDVNAKDNVEDSTGIVISHSGTVELNRVNSSGNAYMGARIFNYSTDPVKITNSTFDDNLNNVNDGDDIYDCSNWDNVLMMCTEYTPKFTGLSIDWAGGSVSVFGTSVSGNKGDGLGITAYNSAVTVKNSVFDNNVPVDASPADGSWGDGLFIYSNTATLENIQANNNDRRGIMGYANTSFTGMHTHTDFNGWSGLQVETCADFYDLDPFCDNTGAGTVTLSNSSTSTNGGNGVYINAKGAVTISSFFFGDNAGDGINVENLGSPSAPAVTITGVTTASNENGINLNVKGVVALKDLETLDNRADGVNILSTGTGAITITNATGIFSESYGNGEYGYQIVTKGPVTITNFDVHDNGLLGGSIDNSGAASAAAVTVNLLGGPEYMNGYWYNNAGGLKIQSRGVVTVSRVAISDNSGVGLEIDNIPAVSSAPGVAVTVSDSSFERNYVDDGVDEEDGLRINSKGLITITNIKANYSDGYGAYLNNMAGTAGVTLNATTGKGNEFQWNVLDGLRVLTNGAVTLTNIFSSNNYFDDGINPIIGGYGVYIDNDSGTGAVTIKQVGGWGVQDSWAEGNAFSNNYEGGLHIQTKGAVTVAFFQARGNQTNGIYIDADDGSGAVSLTGTTNFWDNLGYNHNDGLMVYAQGNITISKIQASGNDVHGAVLVNNNGTGNVTLSDSYFDRNGGYGLTMNTKGTLSWKNGSAYDNFQYGAYIIDQGVGKAVTVTNVSASGNGETGIYVDSKGVVTMTEVESNNNSANYYTINNGEWWTDNLNNNQVWYFSGTKDDVVTIQVSSGRFNPSIYVTYPDGTYVDGLDGTDGSLSLPFTLPDDGQFMIHIQSDNNGCGPCWGYDLKLYMGAAPSAPTHFSSANGIYVDNHQGTGAVTISNASNRWFGNNSGTAVVVVSSGAVSLKGMDLNDSGQGGAWIDNEDTNKTGAPGVTFINVNFYNNDKTAAQIRTEGPVVITNGDQNGNWNYGYYVDNNYLTAVSPITMTNVHVNNTESTQTGIYLRSRGAVTLSNVTSNGGGNNGFDIATAGAVKFTQVSAEGNDSYGTYVVTDNTFTIASSTTGYTRFAENSSTGLYVEAGGAISLAKMYAWGNDGYGIYLNSANVLGTAPITLTDVTSSNNTSTGLWIDTNGAVTVNTLKVEYNTNWGLRLDQTGAPDSPKAITLNLVTANGNGNDGMYVDGKGSITTNTIWVFGNGDSGALLFNRNAGSTGSVTMLNTLGYKTNVVGLNGDSGVNISSYGAVTINHLESIYNTLDGLDVKNDTTATLKPTVTLSNIITRNNTVGLYVKSTGVVTINTSWSTNNAEDGIAVHTNNNVNILNTASTMNGWSGIWADNSSSTWTLKLTGSAWFGNSRAGSYANLKKTGAWTVVY